VFTPREDEGGRYYEFVGQGSISAIVRGVVLPKVWWPQRDSNPCLSYDHVFATFLQCLQDRTVLGVGAIKTRRVHWGSYCDRADQKEARWLFRPASTPTLGHVICSDSL
jgi:hypothetical protein